MNGQASWLSFVSFAGAGHGKLLTVPFKSMLLRTADAPDEASLAAHRCSNLLSRSRGILLISKTPGCRPGLKGFNARGPLKVHPASQRRRHCGGRETRIGGLPRVTAGPSVHGRHTIFQIRTERFILGVLGPQRSEISISASQATDRSTILPNARREVSSGLRCSSH
jgi:hypothetical protein